MGRGVSLPPPACLLPLSVYIVTLTQAQAMPIHHFDSFVSTVGGKSICSFKIKRCLSTISTRHPHQSLMCTLGTVSKSSDAYPPFRRQYRDIAYRRRRQFQNQAMPIHHFDILAQAIRRLSTGLEFQNQAMPIHHFDPARGAGSWKQELFQNQAMPIHHFDSYLSSIAWQAVPDNAFREARF